MKGIQFLVDDKGEKKAVLIDLKKYGDLGRIYTTPSWPVSDRTNRASLWMPLRNGCAKRAN